MSEAYGRDRAAGGCLSLLLDVKLPVGFGGLQHELVQLADLLVLEVLEHGLRQSGAQLAPGGNAARRVQDLGLEGGLVVLCGHKVTHSLRS